MLLDLDLFDGGGTVKRDQIETEAVLFCVYDDTVTKKLYTSILEDYDNKTNWW